MVDPSHVHELIIPGEATRREFAVYLIVHQHRTTMRIKAVYVGKTGDNREGCNPVVSRVGNHMSFNPLHSQTRNRVRATERLDFHVFYGFFGKYVSPRNSRKGVKLVNEMERQLNKRAQLAFGKLVENPFKGSAWVARSERKRRAALCTKDRASRLDSIIEAAKVFVGSASKHD